MALVIEISVFHGVACATSDEMLTSL